MSKMIRNGTKPLVPEWVFGFNSSIVNGAHSLVDEQRDAIFYTSAHMGIIYDFRSEQQHLLIGHCNSITAAATSRDKRWIVTADNGSDSMIVIWDSVSRSPIKTIFNAHPYGVAALDFSPDATRIVTLSYEPNALSQTNSSQVNSEETIQVIAVWDWTIDRDTPVAAAEIPTSDFHTHVAFNPNNLSEIVTTGPERVVFWTVEEPAGGLNAQKTEDEPLDDEICEMLFFAPPVSAKQLGSPVAPFTVSVFLPGSTFAVSATRSGEAILWDASPTAVAEGRTHEKHAMKLVRLTKDESSSLPGYGGPEQVPILTLELFDDYLIAGSADGSVRVFDLKLRLVAWYEDLNAGPITSISFAANGTITTELEQSETSNRIRIPDFIVGTKRSLIVGVQSSTFDSLSVVERQGTVLVQGIDGNIRALAALPLQNKSYAVVASSSGAVQLWDYDEKSLLMVRLLDNQRYIPECCGVDPKGTILAIGTKRGEVLFLDSMQLTDLQTPERVGQSTIHQLAFSPDGQYLATADRSRHVAIFRYETTIVDDIQLQGKKPWELDDGEERRVREIQRWVYLGRAKSHNSDITGLEFGMSDAETPILVSVGEDRRIVQYDVKACSVEGGIVFRGQRHKVEQSAIPTACMWYPVHQSTHELEPNITHKTSKHSSPNQGEDNLFGAGSPTTQSAHGRTAISDMNQDKSSMPGAAVRRERLLVTANDEYKFKLWNAETMTCRRTVLAPTYGGPISRMTLLQKPSWILTQQEEKDETEFASDKPQYLVYRTREKVIGVLMLPLDGNPHKSMGIVAHPGAVEELDATVDGKHILTAGGDDGTVILWQVNTDAMEELAASGGEGLTPFINMLEGGASGQLYQDMCDFFAYAQIRSTGEDSTAPRRAGITLPLTELPNLVRALGFYPTEAEIDALLNEVRYGNFANEGKTVEEVDLGTVVRLFVNHRPVLGIGKASIADAVRVLRQHTERLTIENGTEFEMTEDKEDEKTFGPDDLSTAIPWNKVEEVLAHNAESMQRDEIRNLLKYLTDGIVPNYAGVERFVHGILGFDMGITDTDSTVNETTM